MHMRRFGWIINDAEYCDTTVAELWDTQANKIRFGMHYLHTNSNIPTQYVNV